jgi:hypothetical protein
MALDKTSVCNLSLGHVGDQQISDINERSNEAEACLQFYDAALEEAYTMADWKFASTFRTLTALPSTTDKGGWAQAYQYPQNCAKVREILAHNQVHTVGGFTFGSSQGANYYSADQAFAIGTRQGFGASENPEVLFEVGIDFNTQQRLIYTDVEKAIARFTFILTNTALWTPEFTMVFSWKLAAYIASPLTRDMDRVKFLHGMAKSKLAESVSASDNETPRFIKEPLPDWIRNRSS